MWSKRLFVAVIFLSVCMTALAQERDGATRPRQNREAQRAEDLLLEDRFAEGTAGESPETAGWELDTSSGNSVWSLTADGTCRIQHAVKPYSQDTLRREVELPPRYYLEFEARFEEHAGLSLVAAAGRGGAAFYGSGKTILWKVLPNRKQGFGWKSVPKAVRAGSWHRYRMLVDIEEKVQAFYIDEMSRPTLREVGRDMRLQPDPRKPAANRVEFRDYGLVAKPTVSELRNVQLVALEPGEEPPADSFHTETPDNRAGPSPAQLWRVPGRQKSAHPQQPFEIGSQPELLLDDYLIERTANLRRRLNRPTPHPSNPILRGTAPWENGMLVFPSVYRIDGEFRMWYLAWGWVYPSREGPSRDGPSRDGPSRDGQVPIADSSFLCYATSRDGVDWKRPELGHIEYRGMRKNNIVLRHEGSHFDSFSVFYHPDKKDPFRMLAYQGRWPYREPLIQAKGYQFKIKEHGHFPFRSRDGIRWQYIQEEPEPVWGFDRSSAAYDARRDKYMGFWKTSYKGVRSRAYAESDDLVHWTPPAKSLTPEWTDNPDSQVDPPGTHFYGMVAFNYGNQYLGLLEILDDLTNRMHFQLISSRDRKTWNRLSAPEPFIDHGKEGSWNSGIQMMANSPPVLHDDKLWFYYDGANFDHSGGDRTGKTRNIGVSTLPKDRFVSLLADDKSQEATLTTVPVHLDGQTLHLNADAGRGMVQVELLDADGIVLPGFSRRDCQPLVANDALDFAVVFQGKRRLPEEAVRIRFILFEAELSAFWAE